jgi:hypothetical protein
VAGELVERLREGDDPLRLVIVFADWRLDAAALARELHRGFGTTPTIGCTASGVIGAAPSALPAAVALGLYGEWVRAGIGVAAELTKSPIVRSRDAIGRAAAALGKRPEQLDPARHVAFTLVDGTCGNEDAFCIGSAAAAPQIRVVGGAASTEIDPALRAAVWANGEALSDAGLVVALETEHKFEAITSQHHVATDLKTVVTAASARTIEELDGVPAARRLRELLDRIEVTIDPERPSGISFARFVDGVPYVRSITRIEGDSVQLATAVEPGHVLRIMRSGDLIGRTRADLRAAADRIGGASALIAFSCLGRHWEAAARGLDAQLAGVYAEFPTVGFQSFGEQTGMLLVNHTLTALAIGDA